MSYIEGVDNLVVAIDRIIEQAASNRAMRRAMGKALRPVAKKLRQAAPRGKVPHKTYKGRLVGPGFLSRNIKVRTNIARDKNRVFGSIRPEAEAWYGSLLNNGWRPGRRSKAIKKAGRSGSLSEKQLSDLGDTRNRIPGNNWWTNTIENSEEEIINSFESQIIDEILKEWSR